MGRIAGTAATIAVLAAGISVGHSGGQLVYEHGAANAYLDAPNAMRSGGWAGDTEDGRGGDGARDDDD